MNLEEVYGVVRSEQAVLWAGAGLSNYAGYPNANKLCESIFNTLSNDEKKLIGKNQSLEVLCDTYIKIKKNNREFLYDILDKKLGKKPKSIMYHEKLSRIPHIQTIITTNYDSLFELGYKSQINVISNSSELELLNKSQPNLFKIHGDLNHKESIIISKSDYAHFYTGLMNNAFWTTIKERIINNNIIFIGYSLGDINVETIMTSISGELGSSQKKHFLVAPNFPEHIIEDLRSKNIQYINLTGEQFIDGLITNIKENIVNDKKAGKIGLDVLNTFMLNHDLTADFLAANGGHIIGRVSSKDNKPKDGTLLISGDQVSTEQLTNFFTGRTFGELDLSQLEKVAISISGINLWDKTDFESLKLVSRPIFETTFDIEFDNGMGYRAIPVKIYSSEFKHKLEVNLKGKIIEIEIDRVKEESNFSITHGPKYGNPKEELEVFELLKYFTEGQPFTVFSKTGKAYPGGIECDEKMLHEVKKYVRYFGMLLDIEKHYKLRFSSIDRISDGIFTQVKILHESIQNKELFFEFDSHVDAKFGVIDDLQKFKDLNQSTPDEISVELKNHVISIYGQDILFELRIYRLYNPYISNLDEFINGETKTARIISKSKKASEQYYLPGTAPVKLAL